MSQDMQEIGQLFVSKRKEKNISLKEVETATSIRMQYLELIELGQMDKLISPIYAQGFVRQYAAYLGLDGDQIISENSEVFRRPIQQEFSYGIGSLETRGNPGGGVRLIPNILWVLAFGAMVLGAYFLAKFLEVL